MYSIDTPIPIHSASGLSYSDPAELCGYQLMLCKIYEEAGGFSYPPATNATVRKVREEGEVWLRGVRDLINRILTRRPADQILPTLAAIPGLLDSYDFFYRICNRRQCFDYLREIKLKTVDRWLKGDKTISQTDIVLLLLTETDRDIQTLEERYADYAIEMMGRWIEELTHYGRFKDITPEEEYKRLRYLLNSDLFVYLGSKSQKKIKTGWTNSYLVSDPATFDTPTLLQYTTFLLTANRRGYYPQRDDEELYQNLWTHYISRPEVHPFFRQAMAMELKKVPLRG